MVHIFKLISFSNRFFFLYELQTQSTSIHMKFRIPPLTPIALSSQLCFPMALFDVAAIVEVIVSGLQLIFIVAVIMTVTVI